MNYYQFHVGDYAAHTRHLSLLEDLAYRRMIDLYYTSEAPLPLEPERVARLIGMRDHMQEVSDVLSDFFMKSEKGHTSSRCDKEIQAYRAKADRAIAANKARWGGDKSDSSVKSDVKSDLKSEGDQIPTINQEPITNNQEPDKQKAEKKPAPRSVSLSAPDLVAMMVDEKVAAAFLTIRKSKRAPLTGVALDGIKREADGIGWTLDQALRKCVERGWQGFEADWVAKTTSGKGAAQHGSFANQDYRAGAAADGSF